MGAPFTIDKFEEFGFLTLAFIICQLIIVFITSAFSIKKEPSVYTPCPAMDKDSVLRFIKAFEQHTRSQEALVALLKNIISDVGTNQILIKDSMEHQQEINQMIRDIHQRIVR